MLAKFLHKFLLFIPLMGITMYVNAQCQLSCPGNITVPNTTGLCGANVNYNVTAGNCTVTTTPASGSFFNVGTTTVTSTATDANGVRSSCSFTVTVTDSQRPQISNVTATPNTLWPPNHKMRDVVVNYAVTDNCPGPITCALSVSSNEPVNGIGDGNTAPDWIVLDANRVQLRAERAGPLNGRVYTITVGCRDNNNNTSTATTTVTVPHDQGNRKHSNLNMKISPNPSSTFFTINLDSDDKASRINLSISDLQGKVLEVRNNLSAGQSVKLGNQLRSGSYILKATQGDAVTEVQVVKQ